MAAALPAPAPGSVREPESDVTRRSSRLRPEPLQPAGRAPCAEAAFPEGAVDSSLWSDLSGEAPELEAESWSLLVDASFCSEQERDVIRRQDVIFELMRTERHHLQTLLLMAEVFRRGMREELRLARGTVDAVFPGLDALLQLHAAFFRSLSARRRESGPGPRNFLVRRIGDVLLRQFSEENADNMKRVYGEFCSHHKEAISLFKELQQNRKFQNFIKLRNSHLLARRRGIPECILLVTQRITKYPVLVERILQCTREGTEEHRDLCRALGLIKDVIAAVDVRVSQYEKSQKWLEILSKIENKTFTKLKNGHVFRKQSLVSQDRELLRDGLVYWKTAAGRFKDILALLLTDVLLFLQEKDQKYTFAAVDQKPSVISLQKLIAREVANEERGMFLISASSAGPEMYEIHTGSKEERDGWMEAIQQAVESCPEDEGRISESHSEERRKAEARLARLQQCREILSHQDQQICSYLEEKLHIYAELGRLSGFADVHLEPRLLITPDPGEPPQAASLLAAALREAESLQVAMKASQRGDSSEESCGEAAWMALLGSPAAPTSPSTALVPEGAAGRDCWHVEPGTQGGDSAARDSGDEVDGSTCPVSCQSEVVQAIQNLTRLLYSLQAALTIQDTHIEVHKLALQQQEDPAPGPAFRCSPLQDQEKPRSTEGQREELADVHRLQHQFQQDQRRWHRRCDQQQRQQEARASRLQERERQCRSQEELLLWRRAQLDQQRQEHQQNLERLREGRRLVESERGRLRAQRDLLAGGWKHSRQSSLPAAFAPGSQEVMDLNQSESLCQDHSAVISEDVAQLSLHTPHRATPAGVPQDATYPPSTPASALGRTSENPVVLATGVSQPSDVNRELWTGAGSCHRVLPSHQSSQDACRNDLDPSQTEFQPADDASPHRPHLQPPTAGTRPNVQVMGPEGETGAGAGENIVYL